MCIELHKKVPHITIIGWDMAICDDETTKVIEWNAKHCDIKFSEASTGPCFLGLGWEKYKIYDQIIQIDQPRFFSPLTLLPYFISSPISHSTEPDDDFTYRCK